MPMKELSYQFTRQELKSIQTAVSNAISLHLCWLGEVNKVFICNSGDTQSYCDRNFPYKHCKFGQWYDGVTNKKLIDNEDFKLIGLFHQDVHMIVCALIEELNENQSISEKNYKAFLECQNTFLIN